ncbi:MAG: Trm112 family protein [Planctomycetota bacterium]
MAIDKELLEILACPETKEPVSLASQEIVSRVNEAIRNRQVRDRKGAIVEEEIDGGLVREDGKVLYPIRSDIPIMLIAESIDLGQLGAS